MKEQFSSPSDYFDKVADTMGITSIDLSLVMKLFDLSPAQVKKALDDWTKKRRKSMESITQRVHKLSEGLLLSTDEKAELVKKSLKFIKTYCKENGEEPTVNQVRSFLDNEESQLTADQAIELANAASMAYRTQMSSALHERIHTLSESTNPHPPAYSVGGWNLFDTSPLEISAAKKLAIELKRDGKYSDAKVDGQFKDPEDGRTYAYIRTKPSKMGEEMKSRVNSLFESVTPLGKVSSLMKTWKAKGIKKDAAIQHALDEFGQEMKDDISEIADSLYETAVLDKKLQPQSGEQEGACAVHDKIEALYADCMLAPEQAAGKMVPQDRAPMNDTFGSHRESAKVDTLIKTFLKDKDLLEDRFEYDRDELKTSYPMLSPTEVNELYAKLQDLRRKGYKEHHFEKGEFPFDEFKLGWETEHKEHPEFHPIDVARLVLDHMKENEYYYTQPKLTERVKLLEARVYLHPGDKAPKGVSVRTGPKGGKYYDTPGHSSPSPAHAGVSPAKKDTSKSEFKPHETQLHDVLKKYSKSGILPADAFSDPGKFRDAVSELDELSVNDLGDYGLNLGQRNEVAQAMSNYKKAKNANYKKFASEVDKLNKKHGVDPEESDPDLSPEWSSEYDKLVKQYGVEDMV